MIFNKESLSTDIPEYSLSTKETINENQSQ